MTCFTASISQAPLKPPPATVALSVHSGAALACALQALRLRGLLALNTKQGAAAAAAQCMMCSGEKKVCDDAGNASLAFGDSSTRLCPSSSML
jgi:hypothetical protein